MSPLAPAKQCHQPTVVHDSPDAPDAPMGAGDARANTPAPEPVVDVDDGHPGAHELSS